MGNGVSTQWDLIHFSADLVIVSWGDYALLQHVRELEDENDVNEPPRAFGCAALILGTIAVAAVLFAISWAIVSLV